MRTEFSERWVRAFAGDVVVVDSRSPLLFWEEQFPVPGYAFAREDVREDLLRPSADEPAADGSFFGPHGTVSQWYDIEVDGRRLQHAAWQRDDPALSDRLVLSWQPDLIDRWLEEDEVVRGHPRDPHQRVDALPSSRHVVVSLDDTVLADSRRPVLLFETGLPTRYYLPVEDVRLELLAPADNLSHCPYKGDADRYWDLTCRPLMRNVAWAYSAPYPAVAAVQDRIAFYNELVDLTVDGVAQPRPESPFSAKAWRPGG